MDFRLLRSIPIFSGLGETDFERIARLCVHKSCAPNQVILVEEESGQFLFIIERGSVKVSHLSEEGREVMLSMLNAGDFFGEMALFDGRGRSANVTALVERVAGAAARRLLVCLRNIRRSPSACFASWPGAFGPATRTSLALASRMPQGAWPGRSSTLQKRPAAGTDRR